MTHLDQMADLGQALQHQVPLISQQLPPKCDVSFILLVDLDPVLQFRQEGSCPLGRMILKWSPDSNIAMPVMTPRKQSCHQTL